MEDLVLMDLPVVLLFPKIKNMYTFGPLKIHE